MINTKNLRNGKGGRSVYRELMATFLVISSIAILALGAYSTNALIRSNRRIIEIDAHKAMEESVSRIEFYTREIEQMTDQVLINQNLQELMNQPGNTAENVLNLRNRIYPSLSQLIVQAPVQTSLHLIFNEGDIPDRKHGGYINNQSLGFFEFISDRTLSNSFLTEPSLTRISPVSIHTGFNGTRPYRTNKPGCCSLDAD